MLPAALGSDTGGSIRHPAAHCGLVGLKPTFGLTSNSGVFPLAHTLDHLGPMTRTVLDNALMLEGMTGVATGVYTGRLKITVSNQPGSLSSLSTVIARHEGNISNLRIVNRSMDFFDMVIDVEVADVKHLADITAALRATPAINAVERARN